MAILFLLGMTAFIVGTCRLFHSVVRSSFGVGPADRWEAQRRQRAASSDLPDICRVVVPDTVPTEWVDTYRAEQGGGA
jgi:hypothetical protein